ncbi:MAG TPA: CHAT domain-containing protein, partial [Ferruginibacter sp.]|nr:CHAT domain-containing protein [Ferruginibacter sp.]
LWPRMNIAGGEHCMIIPDGILGYLPFEALVSDSNYVGDPGRWNYLVNRLNIYYGYSLQTSQQSQMTERSHHSFAGFFVSFDSSEAALPAVKKEYDAIHSAVDGNFYRDREASLAAFNKSLPDVNLLHISTHSFLQGKENLPVLQLADDKFYLFELYGKAFRPQLVVLSACRTGHGMLAEGEGIISLARGFTATGAEGIVAGLWNMNDEAASQLSGNFYKGIADHLPPADALREAKLTWLKQTNAAAFQKLPYFWAGMIYSGDNKVVEVQTKKGSPVWWIVAIVGILVISLFFFRRGR